MINKENYRAHYETHDRTNSWWLRDIRGIECCRVCDECEEFARSRYNPSIFGDYADVEEQIDED